jgi:hypothetical protein
MFMQPSLALTHRYFHLIKLWQRLTLVLQRKKLKSVLA